MIVGIIPVGGKGERLGGIPFSKEMMPQKGFDYYVPVCNHLVEKMIFAGAKLIVFVHGQAFKKDIVEYYNDKSKYSHILQDTPSFSGVLKDAYFKSNIKVDDIIYFGMPDTIFDDNPFIFLSTKKGISCGLFKTEPHVKVDRLSLNKKDFQVKVQKDESNLDWFWGVLKFDGGDIQRMADNNDFQSKEIGAIINKYPKNFLYFNHFYDLGTWENINIYWSNTYNDNREIETKYDATGVNIDDFCKLIEREINNAKKIEVISTDYYFKSPNDNIEFVRYRFAHKDYPDSKSDITIKNFHQSSVNRLELTLETKNNDPKSVIYFFKLLGINFDFEVEKYCKIYFHNEAIIVFYKFVIENKPIQIIEIESKTVDFSVIKKYEDLLQDLKGFDRTKIIKKSKYQIIKDIL